MENRNYEELAFSSYFHTFQVECDDGSLAGEPTQLVAKSVPEVVKVMQADDELLALPRAAFHVVIFVQLKAEYVG